VTAPLPPLALYVHVPWCVRKCPYCDFNSHELSGELPVDAYVARALADLDTELDAVDGRPLTSIFVGGGTPSLLPAAAVGELLDGIAARVPLADDAEITLEANPGTAEAMRFADLRAAGVNRLSLGVQSFSDRALAALGRIHDGAEAVAAVERARAGGFERLNIDLMHGLPGQTREEALTDLDRALALGVEHLSWYQLTIEPNTAFHRRPPTLPDEDVLGAIEDEGAERLARAGFERYEVSAWGRNGDRARHNLVYWTFGDYLGIGPGAHGKVSRRHGAGLAVERRRRTRMPADWFEDGGTGAPPKVLTTPVTREALIEEFALNALRLVDGVDPALFEARTGMDAAAIAAPVAALRAEGLMREDRFGVTPLGLRFLDRVVGRFLN
jgi:oxygen-independent coproporphyrinogen-3 oxidase